MANRPFWLRRPVLLLRDLLADRERPDLARLERTDDPEEFVWAILPHAARTFSACIALLPASAALPAAVAYLYCRILDTYEDLVPDRAAREAALVAFAARLDAAPAGGTLPAAPTISEASDRDERDRAHLLLVRRHALVDRAFLSLDAPTRGIVRDLVHDMAEGMRWSSATFAAQGGVLEDDAQLAAYCRHVLGNPVVFTVRLVRLRRGAPAELAPAEREDAMRVGEMVQLANVTRDVEKDLRRGVAYDPSLRADLGREPASDPALAERCRAARARLLRLALSRAPSYAKMLDAMVLPRVSVARASAVLMLLFTDRYFRSCARRCGVPAWRGTDATLLLLPRALPAVVSTAYARRLVGRVERAFVAASVR
jgi:phytoene/squalene synthetase